MNKPREYSCDDPNPSWNAILYTPPYYTLNPAQITNLQKQTKVSVRIKKLPDKPCSINSFLKSVYFQHQHYRLPSGVANPNG